MIVQRLQEYLSQQLSHPSGWGGRLLLRLLNRENAMMNQLALEQLQVQKGQQILEIGFGGGDLIARLLQTGLSLQIAGIDLSSVAIATVQQRFKTAIFHNHLTVHQASAVAIPFSDDTFDAVVTVNTVYFWADIETVLKQCYRVLKPGARVAIAYNSKAFLEKNQMTQHGCQTYAVEDVEAYLSIAGFTDIQTVSDHSTSNGQFFCTSGVKSSS